MGEGRDRLFRARERRAPPLRDEKVLAGWSALAIRALAEAGAALGRADYVAAAEAGGDFILREMRRDELLLHTWKDGQAKVGAFLEDYGALGNALLSLHEATLEPRWLAEVRWCSERVLEAFWDEAEGIFHDAARDAEPLFMRPRDPMDNATPSGTSLTAELLVRAGHLFDESRYAEAAARAVAREAAAMERYPTAFGRLLGVVDRMEAPPVEVAIVGRRSDQATRALLGTASAPFHRNRTVVGCEPGDATALVPLLKGKDAPGGVSTAYVCHAYACRAPVTDPASLAAALGEASSG
jgi:uncharacterized protein YyaL (SSP411 family)